MKVILRPNRAEEAQALFGIWRRAVAATHHFIRPGDLAEIERVAWEEYLASATGLVVAEAGDRPVGFMDLDGEHIDSLFVDSSCHGRGVGRRLVEHARALHPVVTVDVNEQNEGAAAFYKRLGFRRTGRSPVDSEGRPYPLLHLELG